MRTLKQFAVVIAFLFAQVAFAQDAPLPSNYTLTKAEDFAKYEKDVVNCINWLENTPLNQSTDKRKEINKFVITWISGSPDVSIEVRANIINFTDKNPDLLIIFMGGWTKFAIENPNSQKDLLKGNIAGLKSVIKVYKMGNGIKKDKDIEKLITLDSKGELEKWVEKQLK